MLILFSHSLLFVLNAFISTPRLRGPGLAFLGRRLPSLMQPPFLELDCRYGAANFTSIFAYMLVYLVMTLHIRCSFALKN